MKMNAKELFVELWMRCQVDFRINFIGIIIAKKKKIIENEEDGLSFNDTKALHIKFDAF